MTISNCVEKIFGYSLAYSCAPNIDTDVKSTLRLLLLAGTNFSVLVVCCIWQVFILAFFDEFLIDYK